MLLEEQRRGGFRHLPLDVARSEIRLLLLNASVTASSEGLNPIICSLSHVSLNSHPSYEALSYSWIDQAGDISLQTATIEIDGESFIISKNLESALRRLRRGDRDRVLWIDAICINQEDIPERSEQVGKMKTIYSSASNVVAWVGEEYNDSEVAMAALKDILSHGSLQKWYESLPEEENGEAKGTIAITAIINLWFRRYWSRVWILQEIAFAREIDLHCGADSISWPQLAILNGMFREANVFSFDTWGGTSIGHITNAIAGNGPNLFQRFLPGEEHKKLTLGKLLAKNRGMIATEPRDKVYSLLGLASNITPENFVIDYNRSIEQVFVDAAEFVIFKEADLSILAENKDPEHASPDIPSWAVYWTGFPFMHRSVATFCIEGCFSAGGPTHHSQPLPSLGENILSVSGIRIATIDAVGVPMSGFNDVNMTFGPAFKIMHNWWDLYYSTGRSETVTPGAFVDILTYGQWYISPELQYQVAHIQEGFLLSFAIVLRAYYDNEGPYDETLTKLIDLSKPVPTGGELRKAETQLWDAVPRCEERRFIVCTKENGSTAKPAENATSSSSISKIIGMGPRHVQAGDIVVAVLGCPIPLVLREEAGGQWQNIGDAYVDGYMQGEAVGDMKNVESFALI